MEDKRIKIMGILNVTPDSFYDGGKFDDPVAAADRAFIMADEGADIIDIGGESTRPGSEPVSTQQEIDRVCPVIEKLKDLERPVSIDTTKAVVAEEALKLGASIINDISGLKFDPAMIDTAVRYNAGVVISHIKGIPGDMQKNPVYENLIEEILLYLSESAEKAETAGVSTDKIIIDPGIGFGKTLEDNYRIINSLSRFKETGYPVLMGLSNKSLIARLYSEDEDRLPATLALNAVSVYNGADIIRVHNVKEHKLMIESLNMLKKVS